MKMAFWLENANGPFSIFGQELILELFFPFLAPVTTGRFIDLTPALPAKFWELLLMKSLPLANLSGLVMGKIVKEDIFMVIKPNDQVFLGHKLESCQFAANIRERIARRAMVCVDPDQPVIVFDYDHRWLHCNALELPQIS